MVRLNEIKKIAVLRAGGASTNKKGLEGELRIGALTGNNAAFRYDRFWIITKEPLAFSEIDKLIAELQELKAEVEKHEAQKQALVTRFTHE